MKKSLIYTSAAGLALLASVTTTVLIDSASAQPTTANEDTVLATLTDQTTLGTALTSQDETVYIITDTAGTPTKTFVGNILEASAPTLPVDLSIAYTLDGKPVSADQIAGKSGHVQIAYTYTSTKSHQGAKVPFLTLTGLSLDSTKFKNLQLSNGKIISESDNIMVAGYAVAGLGENLGTDLIPNSFTLEADVTDFELGTTYALATSELFAELDTSRLSSVDDLISSMAQLEFGIEQILAGSTSLDDGINQLASGIKELQSGAATLSAGATQLAEGATELDTKVKNELVPSITSLNSGLTDLSSNSANITDGAMQIFQALLDTTSYNIYKATGATVSLTPANYDTILQSIITTPTTPVIAAAELTQTKALLDQYLNSFYTNLATYTGTVDYIASLTPSLSSGAEQLATGTAALAAGSAQLASGAAELKSGTDQLAAGSTQLSAGSQTLKNGIATFKAEGIDHLTEFAQHDLQSFLDNFRSSVAAAQSYHHYKSPTATSTKFIFKTPSIK